MANKGTNKSKWTHPITTRTVFPIEASRVSLFGLAAEMEGIGEGSSMCANGRCEPLAPAELHRRDTTTEKRARGVFPPQHLLHPTTLA
ncbi:unnamed protein product [Clonostachys chloroleuca]|uniref:Uncharacterized protein n=1 Tax=Clonostachys chloroleuca TaxID=1926264 RepID=A0AA35VK15_9HYPO|nr:unnamed protein product [Clonostachys chloroleuca]